MAMAKLWAKKLESGSKTWTEVPESRRADVKNVLKEDVKTEKITAQIYETITGEAYQI